MAKTVEIDLKTIFITLSAINTNIVEIMEYQAGIRPKEQLAMDTMESRINLIQMQRIAHVLMSEAENK